MVIAGLIIVGVLVIFILFCLTEPTVAQQKSWKVKYNKGDNILLTKTPTFIFKVDSVTHILEIDSIEYKDIK
jgi:heme/copper-type cytochrome/quinol oxidase subunit 2